VFDLTAPSIGYTLSNMPGFSSEAAQIDEVHERLVRKFAHIPKERISATVAQAHARFEHSRVRDFIPLLVERRARLALAQADSVAQAPAP
jgi:hypothetical protein